MSDTPDLADCPDVELPTGPFTALNYHFGMLLGVEDFQTEQAYHRGKSRLHSAWLHREGVVWGLGVTLDEQGEVRVRRGLALDPAGRELHLAQDACLSLPAWLAELSEEDRARLSSPADNDDECDEDAAFKAHVLIRHRACLTRPVPALLEVCEGAGRDTACSRVFETVELRLVPGAAPKPPEAPEPPYHRVRLLLGLDAPREPLAEGVGSDAERDAADAAAAEDESILEMRDAMLAEALEHRLVTAQGLLRDCAARDTADLAPADAAPGEEPTLFPGHDDDGIVLAELGWNDSNGTGGLPIAGGRVSYCRRPSHLATRSIQELAAAVFFCCRDGENRAEAQPGSDTAARSASATEPSPGAEATRADGPRGLAETVVFRTRTVLFQVSADLHPASVTPEAFSVSAFSEGGGWSACDVTVAAYCPADRHGDAGPASRRRGGTVLLKLGQTLSGDLYRLLARGTGPAPLLGADLRPLAGAAGGPPAPEGRDFVHQQTERRPPPETDPDRRRAIARDRGRDDAPGTETIHRHQER